MTIGVGWENGDGDVLHKFNLEFLRVHSSPGTAYDKKKSRISYCNFFGSNVGDERDERPGKVSSKVAIYPWPQVLKVVLELGDESIKQAT